MNGYKLSDYQNFEKEWQLVTVRYRKDSTELRFTYANELAWENLKKGSKSFPDGSVFLKVSFLTGEDPVFPVSQVPKSEKRFQIMYKNAKKHKSDHGWGYALFNGEGTTFPEDPVQKIKSCVACHTTVKDRDYVFSQPAPFTGKLKHLQEVKGAKVGEPKFNRTHVTQLPKNKKKLLPESDMKELFVLHSPASKAVFAGTLDEVKPLLIKKVEESSLAAGFFSDDGTALALVRPVLGGSYCKDVQGTAEVHFYSIRASSEQKSGVVQEKSVFCKPLGGLSSSNFY